jgi:hypothetical protein
MKKIIATLALLAFLAPVSFAVARDLNWDALRQDAKTQQGQQEKDKAMFKALESDASKAAQPGQVQPTTPSKAKAKAGVDVP